MNILATATVVTDEALLEEDEADDGSAGIDVESVATDKSTNDPEDEEVDVDVEECSLDEAPSGNPLKRRKSGGPEDEHVSGGGRKRRRQAPPMCNSEELRDVECHLETKELWDKFNDLGTEMIITKTGR